MAHRGLTNNPPAHENYLLELPRAILALKHLLNKTKPDAIFICEVKINLSFSISKALSSHHLSNLSFVPPTGHAGGLLLAWNANIKLTVSAFNNNYIHDLIEHDPHHPS